MHGSLPQRIAEARETNRRILQGTDKIVGPWKWASFAKRYLNKPSAQLAAIGGRDQRTAERWLRGEFEPPMVVVLKLIEMMFEREDDRPV